MITDLMQAAQVGCFFLLRVFAFFIFATLSTLKLRNDN